MTNLSITPEGALPPAWTQCPRQHLAPGPSLRSASGDFFSGLFPAAGSHGTQAFMSALHQPPEVVSEVWPWRSVRDGTSFPFSVCQVRLRYRPRFDGHWHVVPFWLLRKFLLRTFEHEAPCAPRFALGGSRIGGSSWECRGGEFVLNVLGNYRLVFQSGSAISRSLPAPSWPRRVLGFSVPAAPTGVTWCCAVAASPQRRAASSTFPRARWPLAHLLC